jgi:hypothetical protein
MSTGPMPLYSSAKPPEARNPLWLCNLVRMVSKGNNAMSATNPANAPDTNESIDLNKIKRFNKIADGAL